MARHREFDEELVLDKARDLFWERGYTATSIGDLEQHLGISRSSLYGFFGGKRELYNKTLIRYQEDNLSQLEQKLTDSKDPQETLTQLFVNTALQHADCHSSSRGCYIVNATTEMANSCTEALSFVAGNREAFVRIMQNFVARTQVQGKLSKQANPIELANYLFLFYNGLQVVVQTNIDRQELVKVVRRSVGALPWA